jgi:F-type H+-transporting ATPase subunit b
MAMGGVLMAALALGALPAGAQARPVAEPIAVTTPVLNPALVGLAAPETAAQTEKADPAEQIRGISLWLNKAAHGLHTNRNVLWSVVMVLNTLALFFILYWILFRGKEWTLSGAMRERSQAIRKSIEEAEQSWQQAQQRLADVESRIANVDREMAALTASAQTEADSEYQRLVAEAREEAATIAHKGQIEIEAATKQARQELKALAAALVVEAAERRLRDSMNPELDQEIVRGSLRALRNGQSQA